MQTNHNTVLTINCYFLTENPNCQDDVLWKSATAKCISVHSAPQSAMTMAIVATCNRGAATDRSYVTVPQCDQIWQSCCVWYWHLYLYLQ